MLEPAGCSTLAFEKQGSKGKLARRLRMSASERGSLHGTELIAVSAFCWRGAWTLMTQSFVTDEAFGGDHEGLLKTARELQA